MCNSPILKSGVPGNGARNLLDDARDYLLLAPRWLPQVEGWEVASSKFPLAKIPRFVSRRTPNSASRWQGNNGTVFKTKVASLTWTCTQKQITLLPTSSEGCQSLRSCCLQRIKCTGNNDGDCNGKETKTVNDGGENNGGNMDRGPMMFTSDVSLPKNDKTTMLGEQITAGQLT